MRTCGSSSCGTTPNDTWVVVNAESYLAVNGSGDAVTEGGFFVGSINTVWVQASLNFWEWWNQPPTMLPAQATQVQKVLPIATSGGGFLSNLGGGSVDSESAAAMFEVQAHFVCASPQRGVAVVEVTQKFFYSNDGGGMIQAGFAFGDSGVMRPAAAIAVLS